MFRVQIIDGASPSRQWTWAADRPSPCANGQPLGV
jgi:hypothetical protein